VIFLSLLLSGKLQSNFEVSIQWKTRQKSKSKCVVFVTYLDWSLVELWFKFR